MALAPKQVNDNIQIHLNFEYSISLIIEQLKTVELDQIKRYRIL